MKTFLGALRSKTMWFNVVTFILAIFSLKEVISFLPQTFLLYIALINAVGNLFLRMLTNQPLAGKVK